MAVAIRFAFFAIQLLAFAWMALQVALHASWGAPN
jgi:hypothetical protein